MYVSTCVNDMYMCVCVQRYTHNYCHNCLPILHLPIYPSIYLSICLSIYPSAHLSIHPSTKLSIYL